jgi:hypothetical protein
MLRRLFTLLSALSLLLCVAAVVLWVRGRWVGDSIDPVVGEWEFTGLASAEGCLEWTWTKVTLPSPGFAPPEEFGPSGERRGWAYQQTRPPRSQSRDAPEKDPAAHMEFLRNTQAFYRLGGFCAWSYDHSNFMTDGRIRQRGVTVPAWSLALLFLLLPARWAMMRRRTTRHWRREEQGRCPC